MKGEAPARKTDAQYEAMLDPRLADWEEAPVSIGEFLRSPRYGAMGKEVWPGILREAEAIFGDDPFAWKHQVAVIIAAIGSGKSYLTSVAFTYMTYWLLCLKDPQSYLDLAKGTTIMLINQSINESNARKVVFHEVKERIQNSAWFRDRDYLPDRKVESELRFKKNIAIVPGSSSVRFPQGYAVFAGCIDEAAFFLELPPGEEDSGLEPAEAIYYAMYDRLTSRFDNRGLIIVISSPKHEGDFCERMYRLILYGDPDKGISLEDVGRMRMYANRFARWDLKPGPKKTREGKWESWDLKKYEQVLQRPDGSKEVVWSGMVPDSLLHRFRSNPEAAKRTLAGIIGRTGIGFFWDPDVLDRPRQVAGIGVQGYDPTMKNPLEPDGTLSPWFKWPHGRPQVPCHVHMDLSLTGDATGLALGYVDGETVIAGVRKPLLVIPFVMELKAPEGGQIDLAGVRQVVWDLKARGFMVSYVTADRFGSAEAIQQFNKARVEAEVLSVDRDMTAYDTFKEAVNEGRLSIPYYRPVVECMRSLVTVSRGRHLVVDHKRNGKKDVTDAIAGVCQTLSERWGESYPPAAGVRPGPWAAAAGKVGARAPRRGHLVV